MILVDVDQNVVITSMHGATRGNDRALDLDLEGIRVEGIASRRDLVEGHWSVDGN